MADGVTVPGTGDFATDEVDIDGQGAKHVQHVKVRSGENGGTNPLVIDSGGKVGTYQVDANGTRQAFGAFGVTPNSSVTSVGFVVSTGQPSYSVGDIVGGVTAFTTDVEWGLYRVHSLLVMDVSGAALPDLDVIMVSTDPTPGLVSVADGDPLAVVGPDPWSSSAFCAPSADMVPGSNPMYPNAIGNEWVPARPWLAQPTSTPAPGVMVTPHLILRAAEAIASPPAVIGVSLILEHVTGIYASTT